MGGDLYLVLDQFEEYFLYHGDERGAGTLADAFPELVTSADSASTSCSGSARTRSRSSTRSRRHVPGLLANYAPARASRPAAARAAILGPIDALQRARAGRRAGRRPSRRSSRRCSTRSRPGGSTTGAAAAARSRRPRSPSADRGAVSPARARSGSGRRSARRARTRSAWRRSSSSAARSGSSRSHLERALDGLIATSSASASPDAFHHLVTPSGTKIAHGSTTSRGTPDVGEPSSAGARGTLAARADPPPARRRRRGGDGTRSTTTCSPTAVLAWRERFEAEQALEQERREASRRQRRLLSWSRARSWRSWR